MLKNNLVKQFYYCNAIANDIIKHNKSKEIQEYAKQFAEIESPLVGGTYADWIRINWGDIYIFLCDDGHIGYQVDPLGEYLSRVGDLSATNGEIEDKYAEFSESRYAAGWMCLDDEVLDEFATWLDHNLNES